jgi:hypothetical protein
MTIQYQTKEEGGIELINSVNNISIYKYKSQECEKYFDLPNDIKYIGYIDNNSFIIVSVTDETPNEEFKTNIRSIITPDETPNEEFKTNIDSIITPDETPNDEFKTNIRSIITPDPINILKNSLSINLTDEEIIKNEQKIKEIKEIIYKLKDIKNFKYFRFFPPHCAKIINLDNAKHIIDIMNKILKCKNLKITIDYVFKMKDIDEINSYDSIDSTTLLLCIIDENTKSCVSSLVIKYKSFNDKNEIYIDSRTKSEYEGNKFNKLLRAVIIIIASKLYSHVKYVSSYAINPTSAYLMIKHFKAESYVVNIKEEPITFKGYKEIESYLKGNNKGITGIFCKVDVNEEDIIENAYNVFNKLINEIKCEKLSQVGGSKKHSRKSKKNRKTIKKREKQKQVFKFRLSHLQVKTKKMKK